MTVLATSLERRGWRAEACPSGRARRSVEGRDLAVRGLPLVATRRCPGEAGAWLAAPVAPTRPAVAAAA